MFSLFVCFGLNVVVFCLSWLFSLIYFWLVWFACLIGGFCRFDAVGLGGVLLILLGCWCCLLLLDLILVALVLILGGLYCLALILGFAFCGCVCVFLWVILTVLMFG